MGRKTEKGVDGLPADMDGRHARGRKHHGLVDGHALDMLEQGRFPGAGLAGDKEATAPFFDPFQDFLETVVPFQVAAQGSVGG